MIHKFKILVCLLFCIILCACNCETIKDYNMSSCDSIIDTSTESEVSTFPKVFAECMFDETYPKLQGKTLILEMMTGKQNEENSCFGGRWDGDFRFRLTDASDCETLGNDITSLNIKFKFNEEFSIILNDYNNDGNPDFAINQWGTLSGGSRCYLFSITQKGTVIPQKVKVGEKVKSTLWLPNTYNDIYSPSFKKENANCFSVSYFTSGGVQEDELPLMPEDIIDKWFDDEKHKDSEMSEFTLKNIYKWDEEMVVLSKQQILEPDGGIWFETNDIE